MRVCIPIEFQAQGGGFYFLRAFEEYLADIGWPVSKDPAAGADVLFTNHWMVPATSIAAALRANPRLCIVQRIDGAAQDYGRDPEADHRQAAVNRFADLTIFQSEYCRYSTRQKFPVIAQDGPVIHNPVDLSLFNPLGSKQPMPAGLNLAAVSWSTNPRKGAAKVYEVARQNPDLHIHLCGNYPDAPALPNLHAHGVLGRTELAALLRSSDALLTFSENEACPNHVLEALASGLPVLYGDSGAMAEVIGDCGFAVSVAEIPQAIRLLQANQPALAQQARRRAETHFDPRVIFSAYIAEIEKAVARARRLNLGRYLRAWLPL
jgi:glycosyltransferase involved in cell wall biosynthesis